MQFLLEVFWQFVATTFLDQITRRIQKLTFFISWLPNDNSSAGSLRRLNAAAKGFGVVLGLLLILIGLDTANDMGNTFFAGLLLSKFFLVAVYVLLICAIFLVVAATITLRKRDAKEEARYASDTAPNFEERWRNISPSDRTTTRFASVAILIATVIFSLAVFR